MTTKKVTKCIDGLPHKYQEVTNMDTRVSATGGTQIFRTLFCTQCADTKDIQIAFWPNRSKKRMKTEPEEEIVDDDIPF